MCHSLGSACVCVCVCVREDVRQRVYVDCKGQTMTVRVAFTSCGKLVGRARRVLFVISVFCIQFLM